MPDLRSTPTPSISDLGMESGGAELAPVARPGPQSLELPPVRFYLAAAVRGQPGAGPGDLALISLDDLDEASGFQLGKVARKIAFAEPGHGQQILEIGLGAGE